MNNEVALLMRNIIINYMKYIVAYEQGGIVLLIEVLMSIKYTLLKLIILCFMCIE